MKKRVFSVFLLVAMFISLLPLEVLPTFAADTKNPTITVDSISARQGDIVNVNVRIQDNPGILGAQLTFTFDAGLTLIDAKNGDAFKVFSFTKPGSFDSPCSFMWDATEIAPEDVADGTILTLTFSVGKFNVAPKEPLNIMVSYDTNGILDMDLRPMTANLVDGAVKVIDYIFGDLDEDGTVDVPDLIMLRRYLVGGYGITLNKQAADVYADGNVDITDVITLRRRLVGGYGIDNLPIVPQNVHTHNMEVTPYKAPTCTKDGNTAYWYCTTCKKYFSDAAGTNEITLDSTKIPATGQHEYVNGICKHCGEKKPTDNYDYTITYESAGVVIGIDGASSGSGKNYLNREIAAGNVVNSNDLGYYSDSGYPLKNLKCEGFTFQGWYDAAGNHISEIPVGAKRNYELYGHWKADKYTLTYKTYNNLPMPTGKGDAFTVSEDFTVFEGVPELWNPDVKDYIFLGWHQDDGQEVTEIPIGTAENISLTGYCTSRRNYAVSKKDNNPLILEDHDNNVVYFTYEIGEIRNIPLNPDKPCWTIESVAGLSQQVSETKSTTISKSTANTISNTISDMTVNSNTWTLAETWDETLHNNESCAQSHKEESEDCKGMATTSSNSFSISDQHSGSSYHKTEDGETVYDYGSKVETTDKGHQFGVSLNGSYANKLSANLGQSTEYGTEASYKADNAYTAKGKDKTGEWSASGNQSGASSASDKDKYSAGISYENGFEVNAGLNYGYHNNTNTVTKTGSDKVTVNSNIDENTSSWNNSTAFNETNQLSMSESVRNTLSDIVTTTKEYGTTYSHGGTDSSTQGFSSTASNTNGTSSTVTYSELKLSATTTTYSVDGHVEGKYRCVLAGTAHVFGVVGYDYNTKAYFTYTFSVMDDKTEAFLDYAPKGGDFTDCENSCLPFEIPADICDYVNDRISKTTGIQYTTNSQNGTAKITRYVGTDTDVVIPSYVSDGKQAYRVTEIVSSAFAGKPIRAVVLGEFIKTIPAGAFKNCTELEEVIGSFTEIGDEAFSGCNKLTNMNLPSNVVKIGENAFLGVSSICVRAINSLSAYGEAFKTLGYTDPDALTDEDDGKIEAKQKEMTQDFINSVLNCGADNVVLDLSYIAAETPLRLEIPAIASVEIRGGSKIYHNFTVDSKAKETAISDLTIVNTQCAPITVDSDKLTLHKVFISSNTTGLVLGKSGATLELSQDSMVETTSQYAIIGIAPVIEALSESGGASGFLRVNGDFGFVNSVAGEDYVEFINGNVRKISTTEFENFKKGSFVVTFNANGGVCGESSRQTTYGTPIGTLPTPTRDYYTFDGWYTAASGGEKVTADRTFDGDATLYAHWTLKPAEWKLELEVPAGAQTLGQYWSYSKTENTESTDSGLERDGWVKTGSRWQETGSGTANYASFPSGFDTGDSIYNSMYHSQPYFDSESETNRRNVSNSWAGYIYWHWYYAVSGADAYDTKHYGLSRAVGDTKGFVNGCNCKLFEAHQSSTSYPSLGSTSYSGSSALTEYDCWDALSSWGYNGQRRYFRFDYYTCSYTDYSRVYQYSKTTDNCRSDTAVQNGGQISNVQHWVQYRAK